MTEEIVPRSDSDKESILDRETLEACIHCGLCLPACPTYLATGREVESPRGRIYLIDQFVSGALPMSDRMASHIESCLGCLGCQTACPSGVNYEKILDSVRPKLAERKPVRARFFSKLAFRFLLPNYFLLQLIGHLMGLWQLLMGRDFFQKVVRHTAPYSTPSPVRSFLERLAQWEQFTPQVRGHIPLPERLDPRDNTEAGLHALLFSGCIMDVFYNHVNHNTMRILLKQGHSVSVPPQTCCGALAYHQGEEEIARDLARKNIEKFGFGQDPIVVNSAGCGAMLKHYKSIFEDDPQMKHKAEEFSERVFDLSEFLARFKFPMTGEKFQEPTTYHAACHLAHAQNIHKEPLELLEALAGNDKNCMLTPLPDQEHCCGSAGIYNLFNTELALKVLDNKLDCLESTGARTVITSNPGCQLQLEAGIRKRGLKVDVKHIAEALDEAY